MIAKKKERIKFIKFSVKHGEKNIPPEQWTPGHDVNAVNENEALREARKTYGKYVEVEEVKKQEGK